MIRYFYMFLFILIPISLSAQSSVAFSGIFTSSDISNFPLYSQVSNEVNDTIVKTLQQLQQNSELQFDIQFSTNTEEDKWSFNDPYSLGLLVTRDDISEEEFTNTLNDGSTLRNFKSTIKVGLVLFVYQTIGREQKRNIVYTSQFMDYDTVLTVHKPLSPKEKSALFTNNITRLFETRVVENMKSIGVQNILGEVESVRGSNVRISVGEQDGIELGQRVQFGEEFNDFSPFGTVVDIDDRSAKVEVTTFDEDPFEGQMVAIKNLRGFSDDIFQVTSVTISSQNAATFYHNANYNIGSDIAQFYTDFLASEYGKVVLPPRTGDWITGSVAQAEAILVRDGRTFNFTLPEVTHEISLNLTGLGHQISEQNAISVITGFKGWLNCSIPTIGFDHESDFSAVKRTVNGVQDYSVFDVYYELLIDLVKQSVRELEL